MLRKYAGWMFSKVENGNVKLAFLTGLEEATRNGKPIGEAIRWGIKKAEKTQFRYGKIGTPRALRGGGGVAFQFWSYPIKQLEFLNKLWKEDKKRFVSWLVMSEGTNQTLQNFFDTDLSNAVGVGLNWDEAIKGIEALAEGDASEFFYRLTKRGGLVSGGGILPYGPGPAIEFLTKDAPNAAGKLLQALLGQESWDEFSGAASQAFEPGSIRRLRQAAGAIAEGPDEEGLLPIRRIGGGVLPAGGIQYKEKPIDVAKRTLVGRPMVETRQGREARAKAADQKTITAVSQRISNLLVLGKDEQAQKLSKAWGGIWPSKEGVKAAYRRYLGEHPRDTRALAKFRAMFLEEYK
jgi:hypothetical protein